MFKQLGLAAPPWVMGHGSQWGHDHDHWGSCRCGVPCHTACGTRALFSIRGVKKLPQKLRSFQRMEIPWVRFSVQTAWVPSRLNRGMESSQEHDQPPCAITCWTHTSDFSSNTWSQSHSQNRMHVPRFSSLHLSPALELLSQICFSEQPTLHTRDHQRHAQKCHVPPPWVKLPIQCEEDVKQMSPWSQILEFLSNRWSV